MRWTKINALPPGSSSTTWASQILSNNERFTSLLKVCGRTGGRLGGVGAVERVHDRVKRGGNDVCVPADPDQVARADGRFDVGYGRSVGAVADRVFVVAVDRDVEVELAQRVHERVDRTVPA